jgi:outer membrane receptor protein involved in Fe transport
MSWGNAIVAGRWIHLFSERTSLTTSWSHSRYDFGFAGEQSEYAFSINSSIRDYKVSTRLERFGEKHTVNTGIDLTRHRYLPNNIEVAASGFQLAFLEFSPLYAYEGGIYLDDEYVVSDRISLAMGLRYSFFNQVGPYKEYMLDELSVARDSVLYPRGKSLAFYHHPEPRLSLKVGLGADASIKASYMHVAQYIHLATASSVSLPSDFWFPSSRSIEPQIGDQVTVGYFKDWFGGQLETSLELYYKNTRNQIEFIRGVINNSLHMTMEENLTVGDGWSYGAEWFIRKPEGRLTGWVGYTLARTVKDFERINQGIIYPAKYDRRHDLSVALVYQITERWDASAVFIYASGNAFTLPVGRYIIQGNLINEYGEVNNYRMPPYHRLDISANRSRITRRGNVSTWNFSIYNVYNHANPFYFYFEVSGDLEEYRLDVEPKMVSLFPIVPSISWRFEF